MHCVTACSSLPVAGTGQEFSAHGRAARARAACSAWHGRMAGAAPPWSVAYGRACVSLRRTSSGGTHVCVSVFAGRGTSGKERCSKPPPDEVAFCASRNGWLTETLDGFAESGALSPFRHGVCSCLVWPLGVVGPTAGASCGQAM
jgi:hypothetical protein